MLSLAFFLIALLYASVGFGGGTSYLAMLAAFDVPFTQMPKIALICNLIVVSGGCFHYYKNNHFSARLILPLVSLSVPLAFLGGLVLISEKIFFIILVTSLTLAALRLFWVETPREEEVRPPARKYLLLLGGVLGFVSGIVGIGGGIFLAPILLNLKWARPKEVAAAASAFIFLNSGAGLAGQFTKSISTELIPFWPLFLAVLMGGQIGSRLGSHQRVSQKLVQKLTAILILGICLNLIYRLLR
jgi:uncharacterized protein